MSRIFGHQGEFYDINSSDWRKEWDAIWKSGNMPGGDEHGAAFIGKQIPRIKHLL